MDFLNFESKQILYALIVTFLSVLTYIFCGRDRRIKKYVDRIPGPFSIPVVGTGLSFIRPNYEIPPLLISWGKQYGGVFRFWLGNQASVVLSSPPEIEKVLASNTVLDKSTDYVWFHKWLGLGLLTAPPRKWHPRRKQLTPAFHFKILEEFIPIFNEQADVMVKVLKEEKANSGEFFDIFPYITRAALDVICETAMGIQLKAQESKKAVEYVEIIYGYGDVLLRRFLRPWLQIEWIWKITGNAKIEDGYIEKLHSFTENVITKRKAERRASKTMSKQTKDEDVDIFAPKKRKAFLDLLLDLSEDPNVALTDLEIREETDTFMFEGHDTTSASMVWSIFLLSLHPEQQKKVQAELDEIFHDNPNRDISSADVSKMKYLECCVKEALRLYPSVPLFMRNLKEDFDIGKGTLLPKGTNIYVAPLLVHRDPSVYPTPEEYQPERFLPENCLGRSPFAFIPFSAGPRNCIGQKFAFLEEKILLAKLLLNFTFISKYKSRDEVKMVPDIILRPLPGIEVKVVKRK